MGGRGGVAAEIGPHIPIYTRITTSSGDLGFSALVAATEAGFEKSAGVKSAGPRPVTPASPRRSAADVRLTRGVGILAAGSADPASAPATPSGTSGHASAPPSSDPPVESTPAEGGRGATVSTEVAGVHGGAASAASSSQLLTAASGTGAADGPGRGPLRL